MGRVGGVTQTLRVEVGLFGEVGWNLGEVEWADCVVEIVVDEVTS